MPNENGRNEELSIIELDENLADVEKPPEVPPGLYAGEVQDVQILTSAKGNKYFAVRFVIPPDELPVDVREHYEDGAVIFWNRQIVPGPGDARAKFNLKRLIEALGLDTRTSTIDPNEWMGRSARLRVRIGAEYQGERRAEIASVEPAEDEAPARATPQAPQAEEVTSHVPEGARPARRVPRR